ncbi:EamA-like transporter family protein [Nonomuraea solani]|uniref:EamA-like transporter family protein n=1 Tax=Nonomuraea solani TaxID=1144553 RepID=A0A1H6CP66_9ACTN|nr:DMT family transporter [Nonomuraea solani]SEG74395.1 EamA-like transporter family protein [Nonomuraea solani]
MSPWALALILVAAVAHATWNLLSKRASQADGLVFLWLVAVAAVVVWGPLFVGFLLVTGTPVTWRDLAVISGSAALHLGYFVLLQRGYGKGDLSLVYPVARGTGPMLASLVAVLFLGERPSAVGAAGIVLVGAGVFLMSGGGGELKGLVPGLVVGVFIAGYTVWDSRVVSAFAVAPIVLNYLGEVARALVLTPFVLGARRRLVVPVWREHRYRVVGAAVLIFVSYLLVLVAFTMAPVSVVAPAREVSVLIAVVLGGRLLAEGDLRRRLLASAVILGGVVAIALS